MDNIMKKLCTKCHKIKDYEEFHVNRRHRTGRTSNCKECNKKDRINGIISPPTPEYALWSAAKHRAKRKGIPFDIEVTDITIPTHCPVLGIPLFKSTNGKSHCDNSPTLDRIVPDKGYVVGNIAVISHKANTIKSNSTPKEIQQVAEWVKQESERVDSNVTSIKGVLDKEKEEHQRKEETLALLRDLKTNQVSISWIAEQVGVHYKTIQNAILKGHLTKKNCKKILDVKEMLLNFPDEALVRNRILWGGEKGRNIQEKRRKQL